MKKGRELISLPVFEKNTGGELGEIKDIYYEPKNKKIGGFIVEESGWLKGAKIIPIEKVLEINSEAVYVEDLEAIIDSKTKEKFCEIFDQRKDIRGYKLVSVMGEEMGIIRDLLVEPETGEICGYEVSEGVIRDLLEGRKEVYTSGEISINNEIVMFLET